MKIKTLKTIKRGTFVRCQKGGKLYVRSNAINGKVFLRDASVDMRSAITIPGIHLSNDTKVFVEECAE